MKRVLRLAQRISSEWQSFLPRNRARQRTFPFAQEQWNRKPHSYLEPVYHQELSELEQEHGSPILQNVYHVTTNLPAVRASGRLKSRGEIGGMGLGGGPENKVSATYSYEKALEIYKQLKFVSEIAGGYVPADAVLDELADLFGIYDWEQCEEVTEALNMFIPQRFIDSGEIEWALNNYIKEPHAIYEFYQHMESYFNSCYPDQEISHRVGFVGDFEEMSKIYPENVAILQLAVRPDAKAENVREELELRFDPKDVRVIRWLQP